jgi:hypothetical protein
MKKGILLSLFAIIAIAICSCSDGKAGSSSSKESITYYEVPLVCGAAPEIGCGSRLKPLFIDTEKEKSIKESWSNRQGTVIAIIWSEQPNEKTIQTLFNKHQIEAKLITDSTHENELTVSLKGKDKWYKGMDVDQLSIEEAGVIATSLTKFAKDATLITEQEASAIHKDIEDYFKKELVIVRTYDELKGEDTQGRWRKDGYQIYVNHIGKERADKVAALFDEHPSGTEECKNDEKSCCDKKDNGSCKKK